MPEILIKSKGKVYSCQKAQIMNFKTSHIAPQPRNPSYIKSIAVKELEAFADIAARQKYPDTPLHILAPRKFRDDSANGLTQCVVGYIQLCGGFASRISNQGTFRKDLNRYVRSTSRNGIADIMATYRGKSIHIEVKFGRDQLSMDQKKVANEVTKAGGLYFVATDFGSFKNWFDGLK